ncbi:CPBP family intramembrane metalloprotease [Methanobacterium alkalithermotolerans]|uniref:CPBP family intramembrane metalloprotease n=1 Tax=Methanobacterium alkalithermotolerans TaxID=2731220 RepID=A0A8T8K6Q4_9EURY|nr:type II CAAX endopeptidase family protein [Methanobacterium alkalithermotolerans]QUH23185.1 CPBP family intramembrane metalloprotease [Methanobacterium alkalithermotolerans]
MSEIPFLDNGKTGKNKWWTYFSTIILTWGASSFLAGLIAGFIILIILFSSSQTLNLANMNLILESPLFLIFLALISFGLAFIFMYISIKFIHHRTFQSLINVKNRTDWKKIGIGAGAWLLIIILLDFISFLIDPSSFQISFDPSRFWILALLSLVAFPIQASFEEIFFRGYLMQGLALKLKKPVNVLLISSIIFAAMHWLNGETILLSASITLSTFIVGLVLGIITLADNGIEMAIGVHIINNLYVSVIHSSPQGGLGELPSLITTPINPYASPLILIAASILLLVILFRNRKEDLMAVFN